jgi:hypothetical protein
MNLAIILVVAAVFALFVILRVAVSPRLQISRSRGLAGQIQPLDVEAFRNLTDPNEDEYLRRYLPSAELRSVRRMRLRAVASYIQVAARNAAVLIQVAQSALNSSDQETAAAAQELVADAILLRRNATFALFRIYVALAFPTAGFVAAPILEGYRQLNGSAMLLGRLQNPAVPVRISA